MQNAEFLKDFQEEAVAHLRTVEKNILVLDNGAFDEEIVRELFRAAHSVKGMAGFFALGEIVAVAHGMEELFSCWRELKRVDGTNVVDAILAANDWLKKTIAEPSTSIGADISSYTERLKTLVAETMAAETTVVVPDAEDKEPAAAPPGARESVATVDTQANDSFVRVNTELLDNLITVAGEITMLRNRLVQSLSTITVDPVAANNVAQDIGKAVFILQNTVMQMRMHPLNELFSRFPRVVRDLSRRTGKKVSLSICGEETEIDKQVAEALYDPLMHLLRNCLDHGIESAAEREKSQKPPVGKVELRAYNTGGNVYIEVVDDGRGIDAEAVRAQIVKRGLASEDEAAALSFDELIEYLFRPAFSTAREVTDISGRGVGLDVVRTNIEHLGGVVEVITAKNAGTTFRLKLPLTLAVMKALLVRIGDAVVAVPQTVVLEAGRYNNSRQLEYISGRMFWNLRDELVPIVDLSQLLGLTLEAKPHDYMVFVESNGHRYGFFVDEALDTEDVLVRKLPDSLQELKCYEALVLLAGGVIAPVLNVADIVERAALGDSITETIVSKRLEYIYQPHQQKLLVFECAKTGRYAIDMAGTTGIYRAEGAQFSMVDGELFINISDRIYRGITVDNQMPDTSQSHYIIALAVQAEVSYAIIVQSVRDIVTQTVDYTGHMDNFGIYYGTTIIEGSLTPVVNIHCLLQRDVGQLFNALGAVGNGRTLLVVEPLDYCARMIKYFLSIAGFNATVVASGEMALAELHTGQFAAVLFAEMLPDMSGANLFRSIKADKQLMWLPCARMISYAVGHGDGQFAALADDNFDGMVWKYNLHGLIEPLTALLEGAKW